MKLSDFDYYLPKKLIAQHPLKRRDTSRLLVLDRITEKIYHRRFCDIADYLNKDDCLVLNNTKVIPARLFGEKEKTKSKVEFLLLEKKEENVFYSLVKPARRIKPGDKITFGKEQLTAEVLDGDNLPGGIREVRFNCLENVEEAVRQIGHVPLPPYIKRASNSIDKHRYQTVYAEKEGAVAAPTAGLHFTYPLLNRLKRRGINVAYLTLHVGYATFKPVSVEYIAEHNMEAEYFEISKEAADILNNTQDLGGRVICVGTTTCRALETVAGFVGSYYRLYPKSGWSKLFIYPPHEFKLTGGLLTNFHLPKTTLLMLVSAFCNRELLFYAYKEAIKKKYRFYSYGDAMLII